MAEVRNDEEEHALPAKRKPDICSVDKDEDLKKKQKLETCTDNNSSTAEDKKIDEDNDEDDDEEEEDYGGEADDEEEEDYGGQDDDDDDEDEDDEDEDGDEHPNAKAGIDRKGKGIMREDKGKGKLIEESDDSSDGGSESDGDSDLSGDPLAEVDLDNILPSRTRRRAVQPGIYLSNDLGNKKL